MYIQGKTELIPFQTEFTQATDKVSGVIKVSSVNSEAVSVNSETAIDGRYYPIELNLDGKAIVNVPWENTSQNVQSDWNITDISSDAFIKNKPTKISDFINDKNFITEVNWNEIINKPEFTTVATSGSYNDLLDTPDEITESTISNWGFTKNQGTYIKPTGGIPITDLTTSIQTSLNKADTALQSIPSEYITETDLNGYATESWVTTNYQPKGNYQPAGNYLTSIPSEYITETELSSKKYATETYVTSAIANAKLEGSDIVIPVEDVKVNGTSVITNRVAQIDLSNYASKTDLNSKQNTISDLETIRQGAAKGATALQSYTEKYTGTITGIKMNGASKGTSGVVDLGTVITAHQDISGKADKSSLAKVATSGSYNDLSNKPTIPAAVTESTVSGWGFTKNTGTYSKPSGGIPKSDLASSVQTSLGKADTALQSYTEQYKGTVTGVKLNGTTKNPSNGIVDLGTVITSHQDISGKQDKLVSGTNIKTINGVSVLGEGDLTIDTEANIQAIDTNDEIKDVETNTYVKYVAQTLTEEQKEQVRNNIGAVSTAEIDSKLGDINTILEIIING